GASSCRPTRRHSLSARWGPTPNTLSSSCRCCVIFVVDLPRTMSMICPAPTFWFRSLESHDGGQQLLCGDRAVPRLRRCQAGVAVAARLALLTEVGQQLYPAALDRLAQCEHRVEVRGQFPPVRLVALGRLDQLALLHHVLQPVGEPRGR